jgi:hypothetical protein
VQGKECVRKKQDPAERHHRDGVWQLNDIRHEEMGLINDTRVGRAEVGREMVVPRR